MDILWFMVVNAPSTVARMSHSVLLFNVDLLIISTFAFAMVWIKKYKDQILGHVGLGGFVFMTMLIVGQQLCGVPYEISREMAVLMTFNTCFYMHHFYRYYRFYHRRPDDRANADAGVMHRP